MSIKRIRIGALVGMGPNSTGPFYDSVMNYARSLYGARFDIDFPEMVLVSLPTPFYPDRVIDDAAMMARLTDGIVILNQAEVDFIVIPCNVVHQYCAQMQSLTPIPILNMIDLVVTALDVPVGTKVGLIATTPTIRSKLYQDKLAAKGFEVFHTDDLQMKVIALLTELKQSQQSAHALALWSELVHDLDRNGCTHAVIACTDITPCIEWAHSKICFVDSGDVLAKAAIEEYIRSKI